MKILKTEILKPLNKKKPKEIIIYFMVMEVMEKVFHYWQIFGKKIK